jgi:hypothetical protein
MNELGELQKRFAAALLDRSKPVPEGIRSRPERRFAVYRNNVHVSLIEALATRFPVCRALTGNEFFRAMAREFVASHPPRSPVLMTYGDDFGDFIDGFAPAAPVPYLGDIARLEAARTRAYHAEDAEPLGAEAFAGIGPAALPAIRLALHPSLELLASRFPVVSIWEAHQDDAEVALQSLDLLAGEDALVIRPHRDVEIHRLLPGAYRFLRALSAGRTLGEAAADARAAAPSFDLVSNFAMFIQSRAVVRLLHPEH